MLWNVTKEDKEKQSGNVLQYANLLSHMRFNPKKDDDVQKKEKKNE